jgi:hypothetical protein
MKTLAVTLFLAILGGCLLVGGKGVKTERTLCMINGQTLYDGPATNVEATNGAITFKPGVGPLAGKQVTMSGLQCIYAEQ